MKQRKKSKKDELNESFEDKTSDEEEDEEVVTTKELSNKTQKRNKQKKTKNNKNKERLVVKFEGHDLSAFFDENDGNHNYTELMGMFNAVIEDISILDMNLYKRNEITQLLMVIGEEKDYNFLTNLDIFSVRNKKGEEIFSVNVLKRTRKYVFAIKGVPLTLKLLQEDKNELRDEYGIVSIERKLKYNKNETSVLMAMVSNEENYIKAIKEKIKIRSKTYETEVWIFKPMQCTKCGEIGHKRDDCKNQEKCLKCGAKHKTSSCTSEFNEYKCILCKGKHASFSTSCLIIKKAYRKTNKSNMKILEKAGLLDKKLNKYYDQKTDESGSETDEDEIEKVIKNDSHAKHLLEKINLLEDQFKRMENKYI
jgi:hypothetical protein